MLNVLDGLSRLLAGCLVSIWLTVCSLIIGLSLAMWMAYELYLARSVVTKAIRGYIWLIRGTPLLVQIFIIYYGLAQFSWLRHSPLWIALSHPMVCAILALAMNTACYTTVLLYGVLQTVPEVEVAACYALGMSRKLALRKIILPRALQLALPAYSNEVLMVLKGTSLASTITLLDLMGVTQSMAFATYNIMLPYSLAALCYLGLNAVIMSGFKWVEKHFCCYYRSD